MTSKASSSDSPIGNRSIIPKLETGVMDLLKKHPTADGRGIKIAILDTGCDLNAEGLHQTSDGKPKYLDFLDCTGDGDIDMSHTVSIDEKNTTVLGLSGRNLTLGEWSKNAKELRLGAVRLFHLLPRSVEKRLKKERKVSFLTKHRALISRTQQSLDDLQRQPNSTNDDKDQVSKEKKELNVMLEHFQQVIESYNDAGPLMDVVLFQDTSDGVFKAVIDLNATGDLSKATPMAPFSKSRQTGELGFGSAVTFCVQVYDGGKILSIVTDAGSHGTHVAGIAAANFVGRKGKKAGKHQSHLNGVAPGAQILACKIGDGRLGSAETGTGLVRALIAAKKYGCDLVNLSYGEPYWQPDSGRVAETFADAVHKWGMTVFTSAGNDGPALSSLGSPGCLSSLITVGAFVSPDMMLDQYSTLPPTEDEAPLEGASYYFSSRGPTPDGALPDLCAPGGAIAPIPRHALQGKAQYHGTSMSSPNACGVAACVLSAIKQKGVENCSPAELRRGLVNSVTSVDIVDHFAQGSGLICATAAVEYILKNHGKNGQNLSFDVKIPSRDNARGIYIRDSLQLEGPKTFEVKVLPHFTHAIERTVQEMEELLSLEMDLRLKSSESWVVCPDRMTLLSAKERNGQTFSVRLKTEDLPAGSHYAAISAVDANDAERGSIFQVPVTVIVPHTNFVSKASSELKINENESIILNDNGIDLSMTYQLVPGAPNRRFATVPDSAEWVTIKVRSANPDPSETSPKRIMLHAIPFVRGDLPNTEVQLKKLIRLTEGVDKEFRMRVKGGTTLELCLQLLWLANPSPAAVVAEMEFHSLDTRASSLVSSQPVHISAATEFARLGATAMLRSEKLNPTAKLDTVQRALRPDSYEITSGSTDRDILPPSDAELRANGSRPDGLQIYDMHLCYSFKIDTDESVKVTPSIPSLFHQLYDSPLDSQLWVLKDSNSRILGYGSSMHEADSVSVSKGKYSLIFHTRHPDRNVLEKMKDLPCQISFALSEKEALECKVYSQLDKASTPDVTDDGRKTVASLMLSKGAHRDLYVSRPTGKIPSFVAPGDDLTGSITLDKDSKDATSLKLAYSVPPKATAQKANGEPSSDSGDDDETESLDEAVRDFKVSYLSKLRKKDKDGYKTLSLELREEKPLSIPLLLELLTSAQEATGETSESDSKKHQIEEIRQVRELMMKSSGGPIDEAELAQYFGVAQPGEEDLKQDKEARKLKKSMEEQKKALQQVLLSLAKATGILAEEDSSNVEDFDSSVKELKKWVVGTGDMTNDSDKVSLSLVLATHARICQNKTATAISMLTKARKDLAGGENYNDFTKELIKTYGSLNGADHLVENAQNDVFDRFPVARQGFLLQSDKET